MIIVALAVFGLCLGSFVNALVFRLHMQSRANRKSGKAQKVGKREVDLSISKGRSVCIHCGHVLAWHDLIPLFSWLSLRGKCRYCHRTVSAQYPIVELMTALLFICSYIFWPLSFDIVGIINFAVWLIVLTGFVALVVYDVRWMLLPDRIVYPLVVLAFGLVILNILVSGGWELVLQSLLSIAIAGGIFFLIFQVSEGRWIGGGDVKLGLLIGLALQDPYLAFLMLLLASTLGTIFILPGLLLKKITPKSHIPFGPFLIAATVLVFLFGQAIIDWYQGAILLQ